jgi:hypothetical protein
MSKIKLYIATTLDGFIAREDGSLDLDALPNPNQIESFGTGIVNLTYKTYKRKIT